MEEALPSGLDSCGCCHKRPQAGGLKPTGIYSCTGLEARILRWKWKQGHALFEHRGKDAVFASSWFVVVASDFWHSLDGSSSVSSYGVALCLPVSSHEPFLRILGIGYRAQPNVIWPHFNIINCICKQLDYKSGYILRFRVDINLEGSLFLLVSLSCHNTRLGNLTELHCLPVLDAESLRSRCQQGWFLGELSSSFADVHLLAVFLPCLSSVHKHVHTHTHRSGLPSSSSDSPTLMTSFNLNYPPKGHLSKYSQSCSGDQGLNVWIWVYLEGRDTT